MESAEPSVEWNGAVGVVALEELVMEVVRVAFHRYFALAQQHPVEPTMRRHRRDAGMQQMEQRVQRMRRNDPMDEDPGEIEKVLDRMHREAGPWAGIDVGVMQSMRHPVERRPMDEPVHGVEMHFAKQ